MGPGQPGKQLARQQAETDLHLWSCMEGINKGAAVVEWFLSAHQDDGGST